MEESTQEDNQTNERYSMNFSSPIKYKNETENTQTKETKNLKKNLFALGDRNILISSSPKLAYESLAEELADERNQETDIKDKTPSRKLSKDCSVSDLDKSLSIDLQKHGFPAQNIQIDGINSGAITHPHKNLNHIFISLEDKNAANSNRHTKNVKSDMLIKENIQRTFDDLIKRKEDKESQAKSNIEITKKQLLDTFFNLDKDNNKKQQREELETIYENNNLNENSQAEMITPREDNNAHYDYIKNKYKRERRKKSSIFSSEDLRISSTNANTDAFNIKQSEFVFCSPALDKINKDRIGKQFEEDKEQYIQISRRCIATNSNASSSQRGSKKETNSFTMQKAEVLNIITTPTNRCKDMMMKQGQGNNKHKTYSMAIGAKVSYETLTEENTKQVTNNSNSNNLNDTKERIHSKVNSSIPSYQMKSVRKSNTKKISIKSRLHYNNNITAYADYASNKLTTLPSEKPIKQSELMKTNFKVRNSSNPNKSQQKDRVANRNEMIQLISSDIMKYNKKSDRLNIIKVLIKAKDGCFAVLANKFSSNTPQRELKKELYSFKGLYQYCSSKDCLEKVFGDVDCRMIIKREEAISKLRTTNATKNITLPCNSNLIMVNNNKNI